MIQLFVSKTIVFTTGVSDKSILTSTTLDTGLGRKGMWDRMKFMELFTKPNILVCWICSWSSGAHDDAITCRKFYDNAKIMRLVVRKMCSTV